MPYIKIEKRGSLMPISKYIAENAGELNFQFSVLAAEYWHRQPNYQTANDIVGALEGAKAEFQRRVLAPYEDKKIVENGDVY